MYLCGIDDGLFIYHLLIKKEMIKILITKNVKLQWTIANKKYYTQKGYIFTNWNEYFEVDVKDLPVESRMQIEYKCEECSNVFKTRYSRYLKNTRSICKSCNMKMVARNKEYIKKRSGINSGKYNPNLSKQEREIGRKLTEYPLWRKEVYTMNNFTCMNCGDSTGGNLIAHHINSWNYDKNNRFNIFNGITLCENCHKSFHSIYGYGNNDAGQLCEFLMAEININELCDAAKLFVDL